MRALGTTLTAIARLAGRRFAGPLLASAVITSAAITGAVITGALIAGCGKPGPGDQDIIMLGDERLMPVTEPAMPAPDEQLQSWATAPWQGHPWLEYPGHVQLDIEHDLGRTPNGVLVYLAFSPSGLGDGGSPGLAAGDLAQIRALDDRHVIIWNNTNATYWARVVVF